MPGAVSALLMAIAAHAFVGPQTLDIQEVHYRAAWPLLVAGNGLLAIGVFRHSSLRTLAGCALAASVIAFEQNVYWLVLYREVMAWHVLLAIVLVVGASFNDPFARALRAIGALLLAITILASCRIDPHDFWHASPALVYLYPGVLSVVALAYGRLLAEKAYYVVAAAGLCAWITAWGWSGYRQLREVIVGLNQIVLGILFFALAAVVSLAKAGIWSRLRRLVRPGAVGESEPA